MEKTFIKIRMLRRFGQFKVLPKEFSIGVEKETKKAILINYDGLNIWIPKSCFQLIRII